VSGLCVTKLDVLDGLETVKICVAYELDDGIYRWRDILRSAT